MDNSIKKRRNKKGSDNCFCNEWSKSMLRFSCSDYYSTKIFHYSYSNLPRKFNVEIWIPNNAEKIKNYIKSVHEGIKEHKYYFCGHCGKSFSKTENLKRHIKAVHEGIKDHKCGHFEKSFSRVDYLKEHIKAVHDGIWDHQFDYCEKGISEGRTYIQYILDKNIYF